MAVVENVPEDAKSFVELDYFIKKCINLLTKGNGIGQAGGITLDKENEVENYLNYVIKEHKKEILQLKFLIHMLVLKKSLYLGVKTEIIYII